MVGCLCKLLGASFRLSHLIGSNFILFLLRVFLAKLCWLDSSASLFKAFASNNTEELIINECNIKVELLHGNVKKNNT